MAPSFPSSCSFVFPRGGGRGQREEPALRDTSARDKDTRFPERGRFLNDFLRGVARQYPGAAMRARQLQHECNQFLRTFRNIDSLSFNRVSTQENAAQVSVTWLCPSARRRRAGRPCRLGPSAPVLPGGVQRPAAVLVAKNNPKGSTEGRGG